MAFPKWLTPEGNLGVVPELDYYQFALDAYDVFAGNLTYSRISGVLPEGIQIISTGILQGIPITTAGGDKNENFTFTVRVKNTSTGNVADRTFNLTITNVAPPIITPKTVINNTRLTLQGNISANIGDYLTQTLSDANARIITGVVNSTTITVNYVNTSPEFILGSGNLRVISANVSLYPNVSVNAYPISSTVISATNTRDLGLYFDGSLIDLQLEAIEFANSSVLTWSVKSGEVPPGLTLSTSGLLSGYIFPIPTVGPTSDPDWDISSWDLIPWDATQGSTSKNFSFTIEVSDGVNYDTCTYTILVYPRSFFTADSTLIKVDATTANGITLTVDTGSRHFPIILSTQDDLPTERESGYFSFKIDALDLDEDVLQYSVPELSSGAFDEQTLAGNSITYVADTLNNGNLFTGVYPKTTVVFSAATLELYAGNVITATVGQYITQLTSNANARVTANVVSSVTVPIEIVGINSFTTTAGNLLLNGSALIKPIFNGGTSSWANIAVVPYSVTSGATIITDNTSAQLVSGDQIQVLQYSPSTLSSDWYLGTVNSYANIRLTGNTIVTANAGMWLTQSISGANATISNITPSIGTFSLAGNAIIGTLTIIGDILTANVGDYITQTVSGANATITSNVVAAVVIPVRFTAGSFTLGSGNIQLNGANVSAYPSTLTSTLQPETFRANAGDIIIQTVSGGNATVLTTQPGGLVTQVRFNSSNVFTIGSGNLLVNGVDSKLFPTALSTRTDIAVKYNTSSVFKFNTTSAASYAYINGVLTWATPTFLTSVGVTLGSPAPQGVIGYDEGRFDQGLLSLPSGLSININSGWLTGYLPIQTVNEIQYDFNILVFKKDYPGYITNKQFTLTVLGDVNNTIDWLTPNYLGTIENGDVSDLFVEAISSKGKTLYYEYAIDSYLRLPQGLQLISTGIISGRVSFEVFVLDQNLTTIDSGTTTFDNTYTFSITARDFSQTVAATREFTIRVIQRNTVPYENLYLKALLSSGQRSQVETILQDQTVFPLDLIYRNEDPYYGMAKDVKTLFLPGLTPSTLSHYANVVQTNHFTKRINFGDIKTAVAVGNSYDVIEVSTGTVVGTFEDNIGFIPTDFSLGYVTSNTLPAGTQLTSEHIEYEVVYAEISDDNTNAQGQGPADTINLTGKIDNPYYDLANVAYYTAYPNSFENMANVTINGPNAVGYINKGALPDWMISKQPDGRVLGFTRAVVLAYTVPGASETIAYRFKQKNFELNELDFTVDRYLLDNILTTNYDILANAYITSQETTFDRYPGLSSIYSDTGIVDYAVNISFEDINDRSITSINLLGGLDGITSYNDGDRIVFFQQEFATGATVGDVYNLGWSNVRASWGMEPWDSDEGTPGQPSDVPPPSPATLADDLGWDAATYIPGYNEFILGTRYPNGTGGFPVGPTNNQVAIVGGITYGYNSSTGRWEVANQRIGIWEINIDSENIVTCAFVRSLSYYNKVYVRNGFTHGGTNIYYDPVVKPNKTLPNYSIIPQQIKTIYTIFDGGGTKFLTYRDSYHVPEQGDKYIKFAKNGVFT